MTLASRISASIALLPAMLWGATMDEGLALKRSGQHAQAEAVFAELVRVSPSDVEALAQLATVQGWQGRHQDAIASWRRAIALAPERPDLRLGLARVRYWAGELDGAAADVAWVLERTPADADAQELAGDIAAAQGRLDAAGNAWDAAVRLDPSRDLAAKQARLRSARRWRADAGAGLDRFSEVRDDERTAFAQLSRTVAEGLALGGGVDWSQPYQDEELRYNAELTWAPTVAGRLLVATLRGAVVPGADVLADRELGGAVEWQVIESLAPTIAVRYRHYPTEETTTTMPGLRWRPIDQGELSLGWAITGSTHQPATQALVARIAADLGRWHPFVSAAKGKENEPPIGVARITTIGGGLVVDLTPDLGLRADLVHEDREDRWTRLGGSGGMFIRF